MRNKQLPAFNAVAISTFTFSLLLVVFLQRLGAR